ncbi:MAG: helix-turn-helix domain-containing protein [Candidatus Thorarchaeota archaeon]|jgi:predicted DNA binding protein
MVLQCTIEVGAEDYYSCDLTRKIPVRVTLVTINGDTGFGITESSKGDEEAIKDYIKGLESSPSIKEVNILHRSQDAYWTRVVHRLNRASIHETILDSGCMTRLPIVVENGLQYHTVLAPSQDTLSTLIRSLRKGFPHVRIRRLRSQPKASFRVALTEKQQEAFLLAFQSGYYEMPRKSRIDKMCKKLGIKRVAMQERLRRAERRIISEFAETLP